MTKTLAITFPKIELNFKQKIFLVASSPWIKKMIKKMITLRDYIRKRRRKGNKNCILWWWLILVTKNLLLPSRLDTHKNDSHSILWTCRHCQCHCRQWRIQQQCQQTLTEVISYTRVREDFKKSNFYHCGVYFLFFWILDHFLSYLKKNVFLPLEKLKIFLKVLRINW